MIVLDIETTGTDMNSCAIIDIGAVDFSNPENTFYARCHIREEAEIQEGALAYNGYTRKQLHDPQLPSEEDIVCAFQKWAEPIKERTLAGQNPEFDFYFLSEAYKRYGLTWDFGHRTIDQHSIAYALACQLDYGTFPTDNRTSGMNSDTIMTFVGLPPEPRPHNSALNGALWETEAFSRLINGVNLLEKFAKHPIPEYIKR